jgi:sugar-specific transcriptional regulator TrmB
MLEQLKSIGLSDNEAKVYLAMLELGPSSVIDIARKAQVNRPTTYVQIESLKKRGLVSTQTSGKKQLYIAESPEHLEDLLDSQLHQIAVHKEMLSQVLPNLLSMHQATGSRPTVRFFDGKEGLLQMQKLLLKSDAKEVVAIAALDEILNVFPSHRSSYSKKRIEKGISSKLIYSSGKGPILKDSDAESLRESRYIPPEKLPFNGDITIFQNTVMITSLRGQISGIVIEHQGIAESFKGFFSFLWEFAGQFSK